MQPPTKAHVLILASLCAAACTQQPADPPPPQSVAPVDPLLRSPEVQAAIRRAMTTGTNQRWEEGGLSGYAVPSASARADGCRTVRWTVDQRPEMPLSTVNACDAGARR
jgi:hypothetical protein